MSTVSARSLLRSSLPLVGVFVTAAAFAQSGAGDRTQSRDDVSSTIVSVDLHNADVREAVRKLCKDAHANFTMSPKVQGSVTIMLQNVPFDVALKNIVSQVDAGVQRHNSIFEIKPKLVHKAPAMPSGPVPPPSTTMIDELMFKNADVRDALRDIFKLTGASFAVAPNVQGTITLALKNVTLDVALDNVLHQVNATFRVRGGVYRVVAKNG